METHDKGHDEAGEAVEDSKEKEVVIDEFGGRKKKCLDESNGERLVAVDGFDGSVGVDVGYEGLDGGVRAVEEGMAESGGGAGDVPGFVDGPVPGASGGTG